mgnify:CR=1 FL=1
MGVHLDVLDCKTEGEWLLYGKEIILITNVNFLNLKLHSSKEAGE